MTKPLSEDSVARQGAGTQYGVRQLFRRPAPLAAGIAIFEIKVFEDDEVVTAGAGKFKFDIPSDLDGAELIDCEAWVTAPSSSGTVIVQIAQNGGATDMLSSELVIDVGELNDDDSAAPFVINIANAEVAYKDEIWINVDNAGVDAKGLGVCLKFTPSDNAAIALRGTTGRAGGITDFQGPWTNTTTYVAGDVVTNNNNTYVSVQDHTSDQPNDEPGVGTNWMDFWVEIGAIPLTAGCTVTISAQYPIQSGSKTMIVMPFDATLTEARIFGDVAGNATVDLWKTDYLNYPPDVTDSITGGSPLVLSGSIKNADLTLTGWTTSLAEGDIIVPYVSGVTLITRLAIFLKMEKP